MDQMWFRGFHSLTSRNCKRKILAIKMSMDGKYAKKTSHRKVNIKHLQSPERTTCRQHVRIFPSLHRLSLPALLALALEESEAAWQVRSRSSVQQYGEDIKHLVPTAGGWPDTSLSWGQGGTLNAVDNSDGFTGLGSHSN